MKIAEPEVLHVAHLARLEFNTEEREKITSQMNDILLYMDKLNEVDTTDIPPLSSASSLTNAFREDTILNSLNIDLAMANAPEAGADCFIVPRIVE